MEENSKYKKYAVITGASSGIGREMAKILYKKGYGLILAARREDRLAGLSKELMMSAGNKDSSHIKIIRCDLVEKSDISRLLSLVDSVDVDVFINNAGFGHIGGFLDTDVHLDERMLALNVRAVHILTKEMISRFQEKDRGYLLNVASSAGLMPAGPYMSEYYATKSYVAVLTRSIAAELRAENSDVYAGILAPGPVATEFSRVAGAKHNGGIPPYKCAKIAIDGMFKRKTVIVPGFSVRMGIFFSRFAPAGLISAFLANHQKKKLKAD